MRAKEQITEKFHGGGPNFRISNPHLTCRFSHEPFLSISTIRIKFGATLADIKDQAGKRQTCQIVASFCTILLRDQCLETLNIILKPKKHGSFTIKKLWSFIYKICNRRSKCQNDAFSDRIDETFSEKQLFNHD